MTTIEQRRASLDATGFVLWQGALGTAHLEILVAAVEAAASTHHARRRSGQTFAVRNLLWQHAGFARLLDEVGASELASSILGVPVRPIDATLFDKIPAANWRVAGHQDLVLAVERAPEHLAPTIRAGVTYVEAPAAMLERLVALRIHLDDSPHDNGALALAPGSHTKGRLRDAQLDELASRFVICPAKAGDVLFMRPLVAGGLPDRLTPREASGPVPP